MLVGSAKIISAFGKASVLDLPDPIFGASFRHIILFVGILEIILSSICLFTGKNDLSLYLVTWLGACFLQYRIGLAWIGYHRPCHCLGSLTDALHISDQTADRIATFLLSYLIIGSGCLIISNCKVFRAIL